MYMYAPQTKVQIDWMHVQSLDEITLMKTSFHAPMIWFDNTMPRLYRSRCYCIRIDSFSVHWHPDAAAGCEYYFFEVVVPFSFFSGIRPIYIN